MKPFVINRHGRLVFPSNFLPELDFTVLGTLEQLAAVIARDFEAKAPTGTDILDAGRVGRVRERYELLRDVALNLFWVNRYAMTMYEKRPMRWRDVPRRRDDVFLPVLTPWEDGERKVAAVGAAYDAPRRRSDRGGRGPHLPRCSSTSSPTAGTTRRSCPAIKPTVAEMLADAGALTCCLSPTTPTSRSSATRRSATAARRSPSSRRCIAWRWCSTTSIRGTARRRGCRRSATLDDDEFVVVFAPRNRDVERVHPPRPARRRRARARAPRRRRAARRRRRPYPPVRGRRAVRGASRGSSRWPSSRASTSARTRT